MPFNVSFYTRLIKFDNVLKHILYEEPDIKGIDQMCLLTLVCARAHVPMSP